jgi:hypothetical protein
MSEINSIEVYYFKKFPLALNGMKGSGSPGPKLE